MKNARNVNNKKSLNLINFRASHVNKYKTLNRRYFASYFAFCNPLARNIRTRDANGLIAADDDESRVFFSLEKTE